jgi:PAS domain S-box-containing protein
MKLGLFHFQLLYNVLENIHFIYDEGELAEVVLEKVGEALNAGAGTVFRIEEDGTIVPLASQGVSLETLRRTEFRVGKGVAGWVAKYVQPVKVDDPKKDSRFSLAVDKETGFKTRSIVAAPILAKGRAIGVIEFLNRRDGAFTVPDLELISMIGREVGIAFENALLVRELRRSRAFLESMVDSLSAGLIVLDADGRVIEFNPRGQDILGLPWRKEDAPRTAAQVLAPHPEMRAVVRKAMDADAPLTRRESPVKAGNRRLGWSAMPIKSKEGARLGTAVLFQDITKLLKPRD